MDAVGVLMSRSVVEVDGHGRGVRSRSSVDGGDAERERGVGAWVLSLSECDGAANGEGWIGPLDGFLGAPRRCGRRGDANGMAR